MSQPPSPLPASLVRARAFTVPAALEAGVSRSRLRSRDLEAPHRGVRQRREPEASIVSALAVEEPGHRDRLVRAEVLRRVAGFEPLRSAGAFYTGRTAVAIYDRLFDHDPGLAQLEVAVLAPGRAPRVAGVRGIQLSSTLATVRDVGGLPVVSPADGVGRVRGAARRARAGAVGRCPGARAADDRRASSTGSAARDDRAAAFGGAGAPPARAAGA